MNLLINVKILHMLIVKDVLMESILLIDTCMYKHIKETRPMDIHE